MAEPMKANGIFFVVVVLTIGGVIVSLRLGLPTPTRLMVLCSSLLACMALVPALLERFGSRQAALAALFVLASPILGFIVGPGLFYAYPIAAAAMFYVVLRQSRPWSVRATASGGLLVLAVSYYLLCAVNNQHYATMFAPEELVVGQLNRDTAFHTAIANMILNYGVASLGMDGLLPVAYHVLSHWWFAALALLGGAQPVYAYMAGVNIVLAPGLFLALCIAARSFFVTEMRWSQVVLWALLLLLFSDWFGGGYRIGTEAYGWSSYFISESYTAALIGLLLVLPLLARVAEGEAPAARITALALVAVPVLALLKFSVGVLWAVAWAWAVLRTRGITRRAMLEVVLMAATALLVTWLFAPTPEDYVPKDQRLIVPFYFFRTFPEIASYASLVIPAAFVALRLWRRTQRDVYMEVVIVTTLAGALPAVLGIPQDSAVWYFLNVAQWFALPPLIAELAAAPGPEAAGRTPAAGRVLVLAVFVGFLALPRANAALEPRFLRYGSDLLRGVDDEAEGALLRGSSVGKYVLATLRREGKLFSEDWLEMYRQSPGHAAQDLIRQAAAKGGARFAVFVPPTNAPLWNLTPTCYTRSHYLTALGGAPRLLGAPPAEQGCPPQPYTRNYGSNVEARVVTDADLCQHAASRGIEQVYVLSDVGDAAANRLLDCRPR
jgi:hypothetical protein